MTYAFRWNGWNIGHIAEHGVSRREAQHVVRHPARGYPRDARNKTYEVHGQTESGDYLKVIYVIDPDPASTIYVIHARPLTEKERRTVRSKRRY